MAKKQTLSEDEIKHVAKLAELPLTEKEIENFDKQLSETLNYVEDLNELKTDDIKATPQVTNNENVFREDEITPGLTQEQALQNAKSKNGFFIAKVSWT